MRFSHLFCPDSVPVQQELNHYKIKNYALSYLIWAVRDFMDFVNKGARIRHKGIRAGDSAGRGFNGAVIENTAYNSLPNLHAFILCEKYFCGGLRKSARAENEARVSKDKLRSQNNR